MMVIWVANMILKGIAEMTDFELDLDARKAYVETTLCGEAEAIQVWVEGFAIVTEGETKKFILQHAQSNKSWLNTVFGHVVGKSWKIPELPKYKPYLDLVAELLKAESQQQEAVDENPSSD